MKIKINNCRINFEPVSFPLQFQESVKLLFDTCKKKHGGFIKLELSTPYKERSSGYRSQNSRLYGHCADIALQLNLLKKDNEDEYTAENVKECIKWLAVQNRNYPTRWNRITNKLSPISSKTSVDNCKKLIDEIKQYADENGLYLTEYTKEGKPYKSIGGYSLDEMNKYYPDINKGDLC
jgi:hypothetical protein